MPKAFYDVLWRVTKFYVVRGFIPKGTVLDGRKNQNLRTWISAKDLARPVHFGGQDLWNPELQMTALDGKQIQELLTVDEAQPTRTSTQYPSETHASWRELPLMYVDRLNWEGAARQRLPAAQWPVYDADYEVTVQPQV